MPWSSLKENSLRIKKRNLLNPNPAMRETGNSFSHFLVIFFTACTLGMPLSLNAQEISLEATVSESRIFLGEQFTLSVEVSGRSVRNVSLPQLPEIPGVRVLSQNPSRSTSISIVNARTSTTTSYRYSLIAAQPGSFTIPPVRIDIDGEIRETEPIRIEILQRSQAGTETRPQLPDVYLQVELDVTNPVPGQQVIASVILYFRQGVEITSFQMESGWRTDGFWREELQNGGQPTVESVIVEGIRYRKAELMRYALFPTRSGELTLAGFPLNVGIRTQPSRNDPFGSFFGAGANQRRLSVESEPITLNVRPLPEPPDAIALNAVGEMRVERRLSSNEVVTGETVELITTIRGTGNLPLVRRPAYTIPDGLELYSPQDASHLDREGRSLSGTRTFTELIAARAPGLYTLPAERVAVFNPQTRRFNTIELPALQFRALPAAQQGLAVAGNSGTAVRLQPVTGLAAWSTSTATRPFFRTFWFWLFLILPIAALATAIYRRNLLSRLGSDYTFARAHFADETAKKRLKAAHEWMEKNQPKEIYNLLHKTVTGYVTDRLGLPEAGLSDSELLKQLGSRNIPEPLHRQISSLLDKCATISYAPVGSATDFRTDIKKTETIIEQLREVLS
ncbi:MAG: protein BatD [Balneolaceae bacterium]|nr:MAG: protein BatD [Balneolaceae bacterium]